MALKAARRTTEVAPRGEFARGHHEALSTSGRRNPDLLAPFLWERTTVCVGTGSATAEQRCRVDVSAGQQLIEYTCFTCLGRKPRRFGWDTCAAAGSEEPGNPCRVCDPALSTSDYSVAVGKTCGFGPAACSAQDTCGPNGECLANNSPEGTGCGNARVIACDQADSCNGAGNCLPRLAANGSTCDDGQFCSINDSCQSGTCVGGAQRVCGDSQACVVTRVSVLAAPSTAAACQTGLATRLTLARSVTSHGVRLGSARQTQGLAMTTILHRQRRLPGGCLRWRWSTSLPWSSGLHRQCLRGCPPALRLHGCRSNHSRVPSLFNRRRSTPACYGRRDCGRSVRGHTGDSVRVLFRAGPVRQRHSCADRRAPGWVLQRKSGGVWQIH